MADNLTTQSATPATIPAAVKIATREVAYSSDTPTHIAPTGLVVFGGADDAKTATDVSAANPLPVGVQGTVPVSAAALPLPTGAATEAKQDTANTALGAPADAEAAGNGSVIAILKRLRTIVATDTILQAVRDRLPSALVGGRLSVDVGASALPTGAATSAAQGTGNASLSSIDGKTPALVGGRVPVDGSGVTQPVSGPLTDTQLRAAAVAIAVASLRNAWAARVALTLTSLASLANGSSWQSAGIDFGTSGAQDCVFRFQLTGAAGGTSVVNVFAAAALDDTTYVDGASGTAGAFAGTRLNARFVGQIVLNAANAVTGVLTLAQAFDGQLPQRVALILVNNSGAALAASGHTIQYQLVTGSGA